MQKKCEGCGVEHDGGPGASAHTCAEKGKRNDELTDKVLGWIEDAPDVMADLMKQFIANTELNARARIRLRMKALLDLVSVDTSYPPVPALNQQQRQEDEGDVGGRRRRRRMPQYAVNPQVAVPNPRRNPVMEDYPEAPDVAPIPGAEQAQANEAILG